MKTYIIPRGKGKTIKLIKKSSETGDCIVCCSIEEASKIHLKSLDMRLNIQFPITYNEFIKKHYYGSRISGFLIDNADMLLQSLSNVPINIITVNS